ncbi:G-protein coupled receptor 61 [Nerophis ophidion]|uniref:G-protein coupled receptor 61 n=1 Tax=Nerophis ophidion TaxID=159077 RepID=UPI002AE07D55|nr:G-protein coupled receptor 61 [Nerophis ophidion]XP_061759579.1 G-protein coupled receptor 61 [Nerophis ophidion]XP_061759580.1 G-protein coupled receptor 61 [Nerophis ophidion]XP_061759581.1 G-protein coupled receptor 61 [Nerophis ophidion]
MEHLVKPTYSWNTSLSGLPSFTVSLHPNASNVSQEVTGVQAGLNVSQTLALCAMLIMDTLAVVGNLAVMIVITKTAQLRKFAFVFHLCLVDLLAALVLMPLGMVSDRFLVDESVCRSYLCLSVCLVSAAILTICAINVERYYYIVHPMRHEVKMTLGVVLMVLVGVWVKAVVMSLVPLLGRLLQGNQEMTSPLVLTHCSLHWAGGRTTRLLFMVFFTFIYFLCPMLIILVVYCNMFKVARVAALHHGPLPTWMDTPRQRSESNSSHSTVAASIGGTGSRNTPQRTFGGGKAAVVLVALGGQFLFCWLPYFSFHLYSAVVSTSPASLTHLEGVVTWIAYFCFTSNPFFYGYLNRQIREELGRHLACLFRYRYGSGQDEQLPSREASIQENFMQFLQGTAHNLEPCNSHSGVTPDEMEHEGLQESSAQQNTPADFHMPGQILEETSEFIQRKKLNNQLHGSEKTNNVPEH